MDVVANPPPPYTAGQKSAAGLTSSGTIKKAPPPPPPMKRGASNVPPAEYCTALFDFAAQVSSRLPVEVYSEADRTDCIQAEGDLSFSVGDRIQIIERSESQDDWWTGRVHGQTGSFPGSYTQLD